jgi:hypothetical protein
MLFALVCQADCDPDQPKCRCPPATGTGTWIVHPDAAANNACPCNKAGDPCARKCTCEGGIWENRSETDNKCALQNPTALGQDCTRRRV